MTEALQLYYDARHAFIVNDYQRAVELLQSSLRAADHFKSHEMLAQCYERLGDRSRAVDEYRRALKLSPRSNKIAYLLATTLVDQGELAAARAIIVSLLDRSPTYGPARRLLPRTER